jgi:hypothetical protein
MSEYKETRPGGPIYKPIPTESADQIALFEWAALQCGKYPELELLYAIPNGGHRHKATAARLRAEGVKAGVPDLCLPVARGGFHGLYIELKREQGGQVQDTQLAWLANLTMQGYRAVVCKGFEAAVWEIESYMRSGKYERLVNNA